MTTIRTNFDRKEARRDRRHALPPLTVSLGAGQYDVGNWSLGGFLLVGGPELAVGRLVSGFIAIPGTSSSQMFNAEVVRQDSGGTGFRFVNMSSKLFSMLDRAMVRRVVRKSA